MASIYVPNGGKDFPAKMRFLEAMDAYAAANTGRAIVLMGDMNVARSERGVVVVVIASDPSRPGTGPDTRRGGERASPGSCRPARRASSGKGSGQAAGCARPGRRSA